MGNIRCMVIVLTNVDQTQSINLPHDGATIGVFFE